MSANHHPNVVTALERLDTARANILSANADQHRIEELLVLHPLVTHCGGMVQDSGCVAYHLYPESMEVLAEFIRALRNLYSEAHYRAQQVPEESSIRYYIGRHYFCAVLGKKCVFKQTGVEMVEKPVYELVCE